jgi:UDP-glucose 4-epimerase
LTRIITRELGLDNVKFVTTGDQRGWLGDSPMVHLDTARMKSLGWAPKIPIEDGIRATVRHLVEHPEVFAARNAAGVSSFS